MVKQREKIRKNIQSVSGIGFTTAMTRRAGHWDANSKRTAASIRLSVLLHMHSAAAKRLRRSVEMGKGGKSVVFV